ncbi:MAG TPA: thiol-disulfide oxidoreductase DCC family protein [Ferruginibacter sp.]|jgi:predicted DCC family thiol-disulfide oxidoreductase YuxK|nr:thiol-disulfide oxidoreductase DCC family protein [Ferruginibacter sp.]
MNDHPIILFDGVCNLCNGAVQFVIKHDPDRRFLFTSLQSETGKNLLQKFAISPDDLSSFVLLQNDKVYTQSTGALKVIKQLRGAWKLLYGFIIVPAFIRNAVYRLIAGNRYKWFGKQDACMMPTPALQSRFLL